MIRYIQTAATGGDCTAPYNVELDKAYTVEEFIEAVLKQNPGEWGGFYIFDGITPFGKLICEYSHGKLNRSAPGDILKKKVTKVKSSGGWSLMDYTIWTE